jgi:hypothetical protein
MASMHRALEGAVSVELEVGEQSLERESAPLAPSLRASQMMRVGTDFCIFALAIVLADTLYLEWHKDFPIWPTLTAGAIAWGLLVWPAALKRQLAEDSAVLERWCSWTVFAAFLALYAVSSFPNTPYNEQLRQAVAFLQGHTYIDAPKSFLEAAQVGPYRYAPHNPMPAIMMMPMAAIWGMETNQTMWSLLIGALDAALAWRLLRRFRITVATRVWLTVFFAAGTILWSETIYGNSWSMPETCSLIFTLLALDEAFGPARPFMIGIWAGLASLSRYELVIAGATYGILALMRGRRIRDLFLMIPGFAAVGVVFVGLNEARYQSFFDQGIKLCGPKDAPTFGVRYLLGNINTIFFMIPTINDTFPYFHPNFGGLSLIYTSPALVLAFKAKLSKLEPLLMFATAFLISLPSLFYYANGFAQFGTRHYLQVFPFLLVLMAMGMRHPDRLTRILIVTSIIFIAFGVVHVRIWGLA